MTPVSSTYSTCIFETVVDSTEREVVVRVCVCVCCVFVYSLQASWKHTILTPHMAATSTISPTRLCRAVICEKRMRIQILGCDKFKLIMID